MHESKLTFRSIFKKKNKKPLSEKSPMFKSPSHYWTATSNGFLHSKGSAHVELSVDPFNKSLIRIFCQSVDKMVNYKSMEFNNRTTVQHVIDKMMKILRLDNKSALKGGYKNDSYVLCEVVGCFMGLSCDGSTTKRVAKSGEPGIFLEQTRRLLMADNYILTILNYWKPMVGFSRRFEFSLASKVIQMLPCDENIGITQFDFMNEHSTTSSQISPLSSKNYVDKSIQTSMVFENTPPIVPRRKTSTKTMLKEPQLILLKGDNKETPPHFSIDDKPIEFGTTGSNCKYLLTRIHKNPNKVVMVVNKEFIEPNPGNSHAPESTTSLSSNYRVFINSQAQLKMYPLLINGKQVIEKTPIKSGDIIEIGNDYAFFFKDPNYIDDKSKCINHYFNSSTVSAIDKEDGSSISDISDLKVTPSGSSVSSNSSPNQDNPQHPNQCRTNSKNKTVSSIKNSQSKLSNSKMDVTGITLKCFDTALSQIIIHYFDDRMDLDYSTSFLLYLIRFCRESSRCYFTLSEMQNQIITRFNSSLLTAYEQDYYFVANLKAVSILFQLWLVYHFENSNEETEENRLWLNYLEGYVSDLFDQVASYVCELSADLSLCIIDETPLLSYEEHVKLRTVNDIKTMDKFLEFLDKTFNDIDQIGDKKMSFTIKRVLITRVIICVTESFVTTLLADMDVYSWHRGIQMVTQIERFESWLKQKGLGKLYDNDGFLCDMAKLMSLRDKSLKHMDWVTLRSHHSKIPICVLRQFLISVANDDPIALRHWQPIKNEMKQACFDLTVILQEYLQSADLHTLFHSEIVLHTNCIQIDKIVDSVDFVSLATIMDTELNGMAESFRWMTLTRPNSLVNFKNSCWMALKNSMTSPNDNSLLSPSQMDMVAPSRKKIDKLKKRSQNDSDYSSASQPYHLRVPSTSSAMVSSHKNGLVPRKTSMGSAYFSRSMANLAHIGSNSNDSRSMTCGRPTQLHSGGGGSHSGGPPRVPLRRRRSGASGSGTGGQTLTRWESVGDSLLTKKRDDDYDDDDDIHDIDKSIERMERDLEENNGEVVEEEDEEDEDMSVGLSAAGLTNRLRNVRNSAGSAAGAFHGAHVDVDENETVKVVLTKQDNGSYGITIVDGMQTDLKTEGIYVYNLARNSEVYKSKLIRPGDKIISINGYSVDSLSFQECMLLITKSRNQVTLVLEKSNIATSMKMMSYYQ